jgi:hypothetical protein
MHWHTFAIAAIPFWVWAVLSIAKQSWLLAEDNDDMWWGGFPLAMTTVLMACVTAFAGCIAIGFYAATGLSPFA